MSDEFKLTLSERRGHAWVVRVEGRLDARTAPRLIDYHAASRIGAGHLVLILSEVSFLSSSGVGALLVLSERLKTEGGSLRIVTPSVAVRAPLELLNLHRFLSIDDSQDQALAAVGA